ncbi:hypothetical protein SAMN04487949_1838 [Halogranum gelatinilyticum]|uniref:Uncharacterized protein n=1 Tax=Halogranum gelatinilyticum TaxID=660521 RepID=A0A1G9TNS5_9EURY|nr:hypothetical protein [Halogranum gelatinilyticum]SDM49074.1 hypothetical protein SAMN04487949_1838 [Halogranum gelatinilyticum]
MPLDTAPAEVDDESTDIDNDSEFDGIRSASMATVARDVLGEWKLLLGSVAALALAGHAFVYNQNMPNGYVPFFTVLAGFLVAYAYHDMRTTGNLDLTY